MQGAGCRVQGAGCRVDHVKWSARVPHPDGRLKSLEAHPRVLPVRLSRVQIGHVTLG